MNGKYYGKSFDFMKVDDLTIEDPTMKNAPKWCISVADFTNLNTQRLHFETQSDGIHVIGPGTTWRGRDIYGTVGDDLVGMSTLEWPIEATSEGDLDDILVEGIHATNAFSAVRMLGGTGTKFGNVEIRNVTGTTTTGLAAIYCNDDQSYPGRVGTTVKSLTIKNVDITPPTSKQVINLGGTFSKVHVEDVRVSVAQGTALNIGTATIEHLVVKKLTGQGGVDVYLAKLGGTTVKRASFSDMSLPGLTDTGGYGVYLLSGTTVDVLDVDRVQVVKSTGVIVNTGCTVRALNAKGFAGSGQNATLVDLRGTINSVKCKAFSLYGGTGGKGVVANAATLKNLTLTGFTAVDKAQTGIYGLYLYGGTTADVVSFRASELASAATVDFAGVFIDLATIKQLNVDDVTVAASGNGSVVYVNGTAATTAPSIFFSKVAALNTQTVLKLKAATTVSFSDIASQPALAMLALYTATASAVVHGRGITLVGGAAISRDASQVIRAKSLDTLADIALLARNNGDMAYNTNAAHSSGAGPVVCNGTNWKHLYTDATY